MRRTAFLLFALFFSLHGRSQTDVTSLYLTNPSFEANDITTLSKDNTRGAYNVGNALTGWVVTGSYGVSDIMTASATATDNNFGTPGQASDGTQMYYIRNAWNNATASVKQTVELPAAKYRLTVDSKSAHAGTSSSGKLVAASENTVISMTQGSIPTNWNTVSVEFTLTQEQQVTLGFEFTWVNSPGASFLLDNVRLYDITDEVVQPDPTESEVESPTEGIITSDFVGEQEMMNDLLKMLADFTPYLVNDYQACSAPNNVNEECGCFKGESTMASNEAGVRTNADLSMICAFLVKYAKSAGIALPSGITWAKIEDMAMKSLIFAYSTHKANKLKVCSGGDYWGSTSTSDKVWESSLWAMSVAYSAYFQWDKLSNLQKEYIYKLLKAECNYELNREIPTGYSGDTKSEENGWEADVLAVALGLFPNDDLAPKWFERMREFAVNSYSHTNDASNTSVIDPWYDQKTVADLYKGQNLYDDYTLQNHDFFHTSYQNVVMQELGEAALALRLFQTGLGNEEKWKSNALMHNNQPVMDEVLNWLALTDGELAMPNGNDWSLFLFDQITSYTTQACFQRDPNALMLENLAYKYIKARQKTTSDGSWLLRPDVQARRMGVEAHRVMMTYLMHLTHSTTDLTPTNWEDFRRSHSEARILRCQNIVRAFTKDRFTTFSWSKGKSSYTGYIAPNSVDKNKIIVPFRANNTGNFLGWYEVSGKGTNASPIMSGAYKLKGDAYTMNGELNTNDATLNNRFAIYSTPGNAVIYLDHVQGLTSGTITGEKGGLMAISVDELTKTKRTLYYDDTHSQLDGSSLKNFTTNWLNIDNEVGFVSRSDKKMAFGERANNNSIMTAKLYPSYSTDNRAFSKGSVVDRRNIIYYSNVSAVKTKQMEQELQVLTTTVPTGWNGAIAADPDGTNYLLLCNFRGTSNEATLYDIECKLGAPVFESETSITDSKSTATFSVFENNSTGQALKIFVTGTGITAQQDAESDEAAYLSAKAKTTVIVKIVSNGITLSKSFNIPAGKTIRAYVGNGKINTEEKEKPSTTSMDSDKTDFIKNPSFDGNATTGWEGTSMTADCNEVEKWNANFDFYQTLTNLPEGAYEISCQGFYRNGSRDNAASMRTSGTEIINALLYAASDIDNQTNPLPSILDEAGKKGQVGLKQENYGFIPNTMEQASVYFAAGLYPVSLQVKVGDKGTLTIGVKKSTLVSNDWSIFDNFRLTYLGNAKKGDVDNDGSVTIGDIRTTVDVLLDKQEEKYNRYAIDTDSDGKVSLSDVTTLVNLLQNQ